ncbi:hypothetical protein M2232_002495 [Bradyrhizobium japonicum]|uniref:hypothetical protein n=1 Tax=Bradyrhizobium japonicum TaxID=375 RepID=UPI000AE9CC3F|nr:hypothetical protein [Bradyrhizobium japonicum]MCW2218963.1 hypothetical protein [Bradyrhizobium japonicum]MCW2343577.1 hypothetical protein [Bradyrhizobium japonicum]
MRPARAALAVTPLFGVDAPAPALGVTGLAARPAEADRGREGRVTGLARAVCGASTVTAGSSEFVLWAKTPLDDASSAAWTATALTPRRA